MRFAKGEQLEFCEEPGQPYTIVGINQRFAIATRPTVYEGVETVWYTIIDSVTWMRGPNFFVLNPYDYTQEEDIQRCLDDLASGDCEISQRYWIPFHLVLDEEEPFEESSDCPGLRALSIAPWCLLAAFIVLVIFILRL